MNIINHISSIMKRDLRQTKIFDPGRNKLRPSRFSTFQLFNFSTLLLALATAIQAMAMGERFSYRGQLAKPDGSKFDTSLAMEMTFQLYREKTNGKVLWGRKIPVRMREDGSFSAEISDDAGSHVSEAAYEFLADALAYQIYATDFYIGLTPGSYSELSPRQKIDVVPRALSAATARMIETVKAPTIEVDTLVVQNSAASVASLSVPESFIQSSGSVTLEIPADTIQNVSAATETKVTHSIQNIKTNQVENFESGTTASTDLFIVFQDGGRWRSLILPFGASLNGTGISNATTITFGAGE